MGSGRIPVPGRQGTGRAAAPAPKASGPAGKLGDTTTSGSIATYNGNGKYLGPQAQAALPKPSQSSLMPGYNVFGDGFFFGEELLKEQLVEEWKPSIEFDNWGNPLPTASQATVNAWKAAKDAAKQEELSNRSTFPYDDKSVVIK